MEVSQDELLEQSKISALEVGIYKSRLDRTVALYNSLHSRVNDTVEKLNLGEAFDAFEEMMKSFPEKIVF